MCDTSNITVGTIVMVKVGRNEIEVVVTEITANGWKVKKVGSNREFIVTRIERVIAEPGALEAVPATEPETEAVDAEIPSEAAPATEPEAESAAPEAEEEVDTPNPAPESGGSPEKKLSLLNAALQVLKRSRTPLNTKEILAQVIEEGLWSPNGAKTPEQSLYSAFFREIKEKETPRVRKSAARRGAFEFNS
ncbi:MAG: winged helix-turn-helix domain-containing protein [Lentisphaeria bacterium]|nr:MAG: winged helix-turn-helix domain-containing protein [Lentisphaeria bacterium]